MPEPEDASRLRRLDIMRVRELALHEHMSFRVKEDVSPEQFYRQAKSIRHLEKVPWFEWKEVDIGVPVMTLYAGPCLITYAVSRSLGRLLCGHFRITDYAEIKEVIKKSKENKLKHLLLGDAFDLLGSESHLRAYNAMLQRIGEMSKQSDGNVEIYLFGQSAPIYYSDATVSEFTRNLAEIVLRQNTILTDLVSLGVKSELIGDCRIHSHGGVVSSLLVPEDNTIYTCQTADLPGNL